MNFSDFKNKVHAGKEEKIKNSSFIYRWQRFFSVFLSWLLIKIWPNILPNYISTFNVILLWLIFWLSFMMSTKNALVIVFVQLLLLGFTSVLDKIDGEIARYQNYFTQAGLYFDLIYHFSYAFIFYIILAYYFFISSGILLILWLSIFAGLLSAIYHMLGKIRHHIKYKITLEQHNQDIKDKIPESRSLSKSKIIRLLDYAVFLIYDWVWVFYIVCLLISVFHFNLGQIIFSVHLLVTILRLLWELLWLYPRYKLFKNFD